VLPPLSPLSITTSCAQGKAHRWRSLGWSRQCSSSNCWMDSTRFRDYMDTCITSHVARSHQSYQDHSCSDPAFFHDCMRTRITEPTPIDPTRIIPTRTSHPSVMHAHLHHAPWSLLPSIIPGSFHLGPHVQSHLLAATQATCGHSSTTSGFGPNHTTIHHICWTTLLQQHRKGPHLIWTHTVSTTSWSA